MGEFLALLIETSVTFIADLARYGWTELEGPGYEAISWTGEVRAFRTWSEANSWRVGEIVKAVAA